ncbi:MAG: pentapeptide repeat-containing protein [Deltaproteobacteria bacterium]|nr:MAG: pentapeptide repeat-containing protein [Deltaproteobacteria bacterium]
MRLTLLLFAALAAAPLAACAHAGAGADEPAPASLADFPLHDQPGNDADYIDVPTARAFARAHVMSAVDFDAAVAAHRAFLAAGGAGGRWSRVYVADYMMGIYGGRIAAPLGMEPAPPEGQARIERLTLADDVPTRALALPWATFCGSNLAGRDFRDADLTGGLMSDADLRGANFRGATLAGVDFSHSDLRGADFRDADLRRADFENADLRGADFRGAALADSRFPGAQLDGARR